MGEADLGRPSIIAVSSKERHRWPPMRGCSIPSQEGPTEHVTATHRSPGRPVARWFTGSGGSSYRRPTASCRQKVSEYTNVPDIHDSKAGNRRAWKAASGMRREGLRKPCSAPGPKPKRE